MAITSDCYVSVAVEKGKRELLERQKLGDRKAEKVKVTHSCLGAFSVEVY